MRPLRVERVEVGFDDEDFLGGRRRLRDDLPSRIDDETLPPKLNPVTAVRRFVADAVGHGDVAAIGDGVGALDGFPRVVLPRAVLRFFAGVPADGGGEKKNLRAGQRGQPRGLGIPLIPADADADFRVARLPRAEAEVARREVKFLVKERVIRDVHLPVFAEIRAVGVDDRRSIVIEAGAALFKKRRDDDDAAFLRQCAQRVGARAGDFLGEPEVFVILDLAEVLRGEELLETHDLRAAVRGLGGFRERLREVLARLRRAAHLDEAEGDFVGWGRHAEGRMRRALRTGGAQAGKKCVARGPESNP